MVIYKYQLASPNNLIDLPKGAKVLSVGVQGNKGSDSIMLWAMHDRVPPSEKRRFRVFGTGFEIIHPEKMQFIGTVLINEEFVFHVFEESES